ncbi:MAG: hypothetical protein Q7262_07965 [Bacteroidales bacterium]|nr:hypothetical protein [Bacteroidales bacterium]
METIDRKRAGDLLERYFEAQTTLHEEQLLREYFSGANIAPEHAVYTQMFCAFAEEREMLNLTTRNFSAEDKFTINSNSKKFHFRWMSIAVAAALAIFAFLMMPERGDSLKLIIDGVNVKNRELALSKADIHMEQLNSMLGRFRDGSTKQIDNMNKMGDALSSFKSFNKILTQTTLSDRLE